MNEVNTRILLVDDHEVVRRGLRALIEAEAGFAVCGEAADGRTAVGLALALQPDIVVMDIGMPELNGFEATRQILRGLPATEVLVLTMHESDQLVREVLAAGARGYVLKSDAGRDLVAALVSLRAHRPFFSSRLASLAHASPLTGTGGKSEAARITRRELETLQLLAEGKTNREVAVALEISVKTAETHRSRLMRKLDLDSVADLVRYAIRNRVIEA